MHWFRDGDISHNGALKITRVGFAVHHVKELHVTRHHGNSESLGDVGVGRDFDCSQNTLLLLTVNVRNAHFVDFVGLFHLSLEGGEGFSELAVSYCLERQSHILDRNKKHSSLFALNMIWVHFW